MPRFRENLKSLSHNLDKANTI